MSMLAGPRRKQKWTLNPRGKQWSEDSSKFGQRMLEKMGWSSGKGLGAQEQGAVEHIRVRVKNDQVGIGYNKSRDDQWTEHQDIFNSFLQDLQKEQSADSAEITEDNKVLSGKSLEEKSKQSQKRVHYKKFTRGKDVNKYSTKDLANIFGKKDLNEKPVKEEEEIDETVYDPIGTKDMTGGVLTIKGGNMNDYFKKKYSANEKINTSQEKENSESESEKRVGFGYTTSKSKFYINDNTSPNKNDSDSETEKYTGFGFLKSNETKSKNKKLNNLNYVFDNPCLDLNILDDTSPPSNAVEPEVNKEKNFEVECTDKRISRKRKNEHINDDEERDTKYHDKPKFKKQKSEFIYENEGLDLNFVDSPIKPVKENSDPNIKSENEVTSKEPKVINNELLSNEVKNVELNVELPDISTRKKKKRNRDSELANGIENSALDLEFSEKSTPKKIKKNKQNDFSLKGIENPALELEISNDSVATKIENSKDSKSLSNGIDNPALDLEFSDRLTPKKNKKNKKNKQKNEILSNGIENPALDLEVPDKSTPKKNKKNKVGETLSNGIENLALDLEFPDRPTPKKNKKNKECETLSNGIENPALNIEFSDSPVPIKVKKNKNDKDSEILSNGFENAALDLNYPIHEIQNTADYEVPRTICGTENNAFDLSDENSNKKRVTFNDQIEYNTDVVNKKKKKKKLDKYEIVSETLKKKNRPVEPISFVNEALDVEIVNEEEIDNELNERKSKKCKRRKEQRISHLETIEEAPEEEQPEIIESALNKEEKLKEDTGNVETISESLDQNASEKKSKRKKSKKILNNINDTEEINIEAGTINAEINILEESIVEVKKKKKKKKDKKESLENTDINKINDTEKENLCSDKDKQKNSYKEGNKKILADEDVISLEEFLNEESIQETPNLQEQSVNTENHTMQTKKIDIQKSEDHNSHNTQSSFQRFKKSKQVMKSLFLKNPTLLFNGSNINEIKGYGSHIYNNYNNY